MIEEPDTHDSEEHDCGHGCEEHQSGIRCLSPRQRLEQPPGGSRVRQVDTREVSDNSAQTCDDLGWKQAECDTPERQPDEADALQYPGIMRSCKARLPRLPEEDYAVEFDHDVRGKRYREHHEGGAHRKEHIDERVWDLVREEERLQKQPLGDEAVERGQSR